LLASFEVAYAPSASVVATLRQEQHPPARRTVAVFADPVFEENDPRVLGSARGRIAEGAAPGLGSSALGERALRSFTAGGTRGFLTRLPFTRLEARAIASLVPRGVTREATGFAANRRAATNPGLSEFRIVHFATHGLLNTEHPDLSGLVLSLVDPQGRRQDGFLRLHDVYNLRLAADLVVLSGCQTALGKDLRGEGLIGLTRGFMYAGAKAVVASLWQVDDESTAELMKRFYRGMLKENRRPADALRQAQLELSRTKRWSAPFYWAGFVLQGDWK
jgi:CHAT domain-containing protein